MSRTKVSRRGITVEEVDPFGVEDDGVEAGNHVTEAAARDGGDANSGDAPPRWSRMERDDPGVERTDEMSVLSSGSEVRTSSEPPTPGCGRGSALDNPFADAPLQVHAASTGEDIKFRSLRRQNPLYQASVRAAPSGADVVSSRMGNVHVLSAEIPLPGRRASQGSPDRVPPEVARMRTLAKNMSEAERLEMLHNVRMGAISVDEAVAITSWRSSSNSSPIDTGFYASRVPQRRASSGDDRPSTSPQSALSASLRGGQWNEMMAALDGTILRFFHPQIEGRAVNLHRAVQVSTISDAPVEGSSCLRIMIPDQPDIYFFASSAEDSAAWLRSLEGAIAAAPDPGGVAVEGTRDETASREAANGSASAAAADDFVPPWLATKLGDAITRDPAFRDTSFAEEEDETPPTPPPRARCLSEVEDQVEEEEDVVRVVIAEADGSPRERKLSVKRSFRNRASFSRSVSQRSSGRSFRGVNVEAPGVERLIVPYDSDAEEAEAAAAVAAIVSDECDERVGEMSNEPGGNAVVYLEKELGALRETMENGFDDGTNSGYSERYRSMAGVGVGQPTEASVSEAHKLKNRYANIMAYDHSRVVLELANNDPDTDYINGNWIDGYKSPKAYIATQGPVPNSFLSFWRMIWQYDVEIIVMVTHEVEKGRMKCHRYWPDPTSEPPVKQLRYGNTIVTHLITQVHKHYALRAFELECDGVKKTVKQYAYLSWPDHGVPLATAELLGFRNAVRSGRTDLSKPLAVHCSAGVGRTGTYIAIDRLLEQCFDQAPGLDVDSIVVEMRKARNFMVQTEIQYIFIHRAVYDAISELYAEEAAKAALREQNRESALETQRETAARAQAAAEAAREAAEAEAREIEEAKRRLEEDRQAASEAASAKANVEEIAVTEHSVAAAQAVIQTSIKDRIRFLDKAEERWLEAYHASVEEWKDRNQFEAENYDVTSALTPIQSRLEALRQKGMLM